MKKEKRIRIYGLFMAAFSLIYMGCYIADNEFHRYETDEKKFYNGEVLLPDMVHEDTLVVINSSFLNEMIIDDKYEIASDGDIYDVLQEGCVNIVDYEDYIKVVGIKQN